jgi:adenylate cyclase
MNQTTLARVELARRNEEAVVARASREGQRFFSLLRIMVVLALAISEDVLGRLAGYHITPDPLRGVVGLAFIGLNVFLYVFLGRVKVDKRLNSMVGQTARALGDFSFMLFNAWRSSLTGHASPEIGVMVCAVFLCFSLASYNNAIVALNTALAIGTFMMMGHIVGAHVSTLTYIFVTSGYLCIGVIVGTASGYSRRMFVDLRKRDNLTRFLAPQVAEHVMRFGDTTLAPVQRQATVLFSDIRDFTTLSEGLPPREVLELLDEYLSHMSQIVKGHEGIVNKFLGDGMLAFWNVPDRADRHAELALKAALDMRKKLIELNQHRALLGRPALRIGIGVHTGEVAAGMLGGAEQHEYTVIGDAVNVASRIEGLNKKLGTDILVSESTWQLTDGRFVGQRVAQEQVKGREQPVVVYALEDRQVASGSALPAKASGT